MTHHNNYLITLLAICFVIQVSWATSCGKDNDCPLQELCESETCQRGPTGTGNRCKENKDCTIPLTYCQDGECSCADMIQCNKDEDCIGKVCVKTTLCSSIKDCPEPKICRNGRCTTCNGHNDCADDEICKEDKCIKGCIDENIRPCPTSQRCILNQCIEPKTDGPCVYTQDCPEKHLCQSNKCVPAVQPSEPGGSASSCGPFPLFIYIAILVMMVVMVG